MRTDRETASLSIRVFHGRFAGVRDWELLEEESKEELPSWAQNGTSCPARVLITE
jgi:hypothetical protein